MKNRKPVSAPIIGRPKSKIVTKFLKLTDRLRMKRQKSNDAKKLKTESESHLFI